MAVDRLFQKAVRDVLQSAEALGGPEGIDYLDTMNWVAAEAQTRADTYRRLQLPRDFEQAFKVYHRWTFEYEQQSGCFSYSRDDGGYHVFFTPDHDGDIGWINIQVNGRDGDDLGDKNLAGRVPFPIRTTHALFKAVQPWLDMLDAGDAEDAPAPAPAEPPPVVPASVLSDAMTTGEKIQALADELWKQSGGPDSTARTPRDAAMHTVASFLSCLSEDIEGDMPHLLDTLGGLIGNIKNDNDNRR